MRLKLRIWWRELTEMIQIKIAWALPHKVVMWAVIRAFAHATQDKWGKEHPRDVTGLDILDRWDKE